MAAYRQPDKLSGAGYGHVPRIRSREAIGIGRENIIVRSGFRSRSCRKSPGHPPFSAGASQPPTSAPPTPVRAGPAQAAKPPQRPHPAVRRDSLIKARSGNSAVRNCRGIPVRRQTPPASVNAGTMVDGRRAKNRRIGSVG